jgi:uncharacterized protein YbjT (DUF2867 family)
MTIIVAVHGATGTQGNAIATGLEAAGLVVRPLSSRTVDLADVDSIVTAYTGVDAVVVQLPVLFDPAVLDHADRILAALAKAGVHRAVFNPATALPPTPIGVPFIDARVQLAGRLPSIVDRAAVVGPASVYLENIVQPWSLRRIAERGELMYPLPAETPVPWLALADLADAIAKALLADTPAPVTYLAGPEALTGPELAAAIASAAGRPVRWVHTPPAEYRDLLTPMLGGEAAAGIAAAYDGPPPPPVPAHLRQIGTTTAHRWAATQHWPTG